ncbi:hypothetical protein [Actinoplanes sp. M2I2]|uniref:hypothetical protein n=1 Tax=Actinoplanes sp. M2I2 TaxID=1734444 RepID=UPI0020219B25|nr:hypothetical protein [Actinoplanes sp. M2I2]
MFTVEQRDHLRERLLGLAEQDAAIVGAAVTGSCAVDGGDRWSDIDLVFGVEGALETALHRWAEVLYRDGEAVHHWDLRAGPAVYRVFLLSNGLELDVAFVPAAEFGPHGPSWRTVFGRPAPEKAIPAASRRELTGLAWHHALHARVCIRRRRWWQAEHWISALRGQILALACLRLGYPTGYAKGAHLLPADVTAPLSATLVRVLDEAELGRALDAAASALIAEVSQVDPALSGRLAPLLGAGSSAP